jgi:hypothetical protein
MRTMGCAKNTIMFFSRGIISKTNFQLKNNLCKLRIQYPLEFNIYLYTYIRSRDRTIGIATRYGLEYWEVGVRVHQEARIVFPPHHQDRFWGLRSLLFSGYWALKGIKLTTHLELISRSRIRGSIHPLRNTPSWRNALLVRHRDNANILYIILRSALGNSNVLGIHSLVCFENICRVQPRDEFPCYGSCTYGRTVLYFVWLRASEETK